MYGYEETGAGNAGLNVGRQDWTTGTLGMALFWTKLSRCFLYKFVPMNQSCSFFELLAKQNSVAM